MINWPAHLQSEFEIAEYIQQNSIGDIDDQLITELFFDCIATLTLVPLGNICEGDADHNIRCEKKEDRYMLMDPMTMPPIVIENGIIQDGGHRFRIAKKREESHMWCYVISESLTLKSQITNQRKFQI